MSGFRDSEVRILKKLAASAPSVVSYEHLRVLSGRGTAAKPSSVTRGLGAKVAPHGVRLGVEANVGCFVTREDAARLREILEGR